MTQIISNLLDSVVMIKASGSSEEHEHTIKALWADGSVVGAIAVNNETGILRYIKLDGSVRLLKRKQKNTDPAGFKS